MLDNGVEVRVGLKIKGHILCEQCATEMYGDEDGEIVVKYEPIEEESVCERCNVVIQ
jgi:hypothetical protein